MCGNPNGWLSSQAKWQESDTAAVTGTPSDKETSRSTLR